MTDMESDINAFVTQMADDLASDAAAGKTAATPWYPFCVLYFGKDSAKLHPGVLAGLRRIWGAKAFNACYFAIPDAKRFHDAVMPVDSDSTDSAKVVDSADMAVPAGVPTSAPCLLNMKSAADMSCDSAASATIADFQSAMQSYLMTDTANSQETNYVRMYCVLDASSTDANQFAAWYAVVRSCKRMMRAADNLETMLLVAVADPIGGGNWKVITTRLNELYCDGSGDFGKTNHHLYDSVVILSDHMQGGAYNHLFDNRDLPQAGHNMLADVIAVSNKDFVGDRNNVYDCLYAPGSRGVTVAYKCVEKPRRSIVQSCLMHVIKKVAAVRPVGADGGMGVHTGVNAADEAANKALMAVVAALLPSDDMARRSRLSSSDVAESSVLAKVYDLAATVGQQFRDFEQHLPTKQCGVDVAGMSYKNADDKTGGCLSAFVDVNHLPALDAALTSENTKNLIAQYVRDRMPADQLVTITGGGGWEETVRKPFDDFMNVHYSEKALSDAAMGRGIMMRLHEALVSKICDITVNVLNELKSEAKATQAAFNALRNDVSSLGTVDGNIDTYYGTRIENFLSDSDARDLRNSLLRIGNDYDAMMDEIRETLHKLFATDSGAAPKDFKADFLTETVTRLAAAKTGKGGVQSVSSEMTGNIPDNIAYNTRNSFSKSQRAVEIYAFDTEDDAGANLQAVINAVKPPQNVSRHFFDIASRDGAFTMWLYSLNANQLTI